MATDVSPGERWFTLSKAAAYLAVHPGTLRRWADAGDIPVLRTPGGHRRFLESDLAAFAQSQMQNRALLPAAQIWAAAAAERARAGMSGDVSRAWLARLEGGREEHRRLGRRLMGLTLQYIAGGAENGDLLSEAAELGTAYGRLSRQSKLPLTEAIEATMYFRDQLLEVALELPLTARIKPEANVKLTRRINRLLNVVQLSIAAVYEETHPPPDDQFIRR